MSPRQITYRLGKIVVEMRSQPLPAEGRVLLSGQVRVGNSKGIETAELLVYIGTPTGKVSETRTNAAGEFQLSYALSANATLNIDGVDGKDLAIPLDTDRRR
jgi:hypothetical protein